MLIDLYDDIAPDAEDSCPAWCEGCDDGGTHVTDFGLVNGIHPSNDDEALARLMQEGDGPALVELGVNDADGGTAAIRLSLDKAQELAELLTGLVHAAWGA